MTVFHNQRLNQIVALLGILVVAAVIRFDQLQQRGFIYWDEAKFALEGERLHAYIQAWFGSGVIDAGKTIGTAKPTHALLIAIAYFILGLHTSTPLYLDAFCSVAGVGVTFLIGRRLFGPWAGLIAALFLAVSEYDVIYARSALSESDANLLFLIAILFCVFEWERGGLARAGSAGSSHTDTKFLIFAGLFAGAAFTANYRLGVYVAGFVLFDTVRIWREAGVPTAIRRFGLWVAGCVAIPLAWQAVDILARSTGHVLFRSEVNIVLGGGPKQNQGEWYLEQALFQLHGSKGTTAFHFDPGIYVQWFVVREGWIIPALVLLGLWFTIRTRQYPWLAMTWLVLFPFAVYSLAPYVVPRNLSAAIPFACLLAAAGLANLAEFLPQDIIRRSATIAAALVVSLYGGVLAWRLTGEASGIARAAAYVQAHNGKVLGSNEIMVWYFPGSPSRITCDSPGFTTNKAQLATDRAAGFRFVEVESIDKSQAAYLSSNATLLGTWPAWGHITIGENPVGTENGYPPEQHSEDVKLFDISRMSLPPAAAGPVTTCNRNVPI